MDGESGKEVGQPELYGSRHCGQIRLETVVAGYLDHRALAVGGRSPERVTRSLHDQYWSRNPVQFGKTTGTWRRSRATGRLQRERQTNDRDCSCDAGGAAGNSRTQRTTPNQQRQTAQLPLSQAGDHCSPSSVELAGRGRRPSPGHPIGLLHQADAYSLR